MNGFLSKKIKLILVLIISFFVVEFITLQIFLANSPKINPLFTAKLKQSPTYIVSILQTIGKSFNLDKKTKIEQMAIKNLPAGLIFNNISKNVSAAEDKQNNKVYLKIQPGTAYTIEEIEENGVKKKILRIKIYKE